MIVFLLLFLLVYRIRMENLEIASKSYGKIRIWHCIITIMLISVIIRISVLNSYRKLRNGNIFIMIIEVVSEIMNSIKKLRKNNNLCLILLLLLILC